MFVCVFNNVVTITNICLREFGDLTDNFTKQRSSLDQCPTTSLACEHQGGSLVRNIYTLDVINATGSVHRRMGAGEGRA